MTSREMRQARKERKNGKREPDNSKLNEATLRRLHESAVAAAELAKATQRGKGWTGSRGRGEAGGKR